MTQVKIVVIGAGNRTNKYMEYAHRNPDRLKLVSVVEPVEIRRRNMAERFGVPIEDCFASLVMTGFASAWEPRLRILLL